MSAIRVLIVDDTPDLLTALARSLRAAGFAVSTARDGQAGLEAASQNELDIVVSDVMMPGLNGFQTCRQIKADPALAELPVILMSAKTDPADHFWAEEVGAEMLLKKPLDPRKLIEMIQQTVAKPPDEP